ncbi:MAG TPA: DivIVA domain-containing protein [Acidimicrobiales bacterium]
MSTPAAGPDALAAAALAAARELDDIEFRTVRRGVDPTEVRAQLNRASERIRSLVAELSRADRRIADAEERAASLENLDDDTLTALLGEETARVLQSARSAAAEIRERAEAKSAELLKRAEVKARELTDEAEHVLDQEVEAARVSAGEIIDQAKAAGRAELERAHTEARGLVEQARGLRAKVLADLADRRRVAEVHVEQLRVARATLFESLDGAGALLDEARAGLSDAELRARSNALGVEAPEVDDEVLATEEAELEALAASVPVGSDASLHEVDQPDGIDSDPSPVGTDADASGSDGDDDDRSHRPAPIRLDAPGDGSDHSSGLRIIGGAPPAQPTEDSRTDDAGAAHDIDLPEEELIAATTRDEDSDEPTVRVVADDQAPEPDPAVEDEPPADLTGDTGPVETEAAAVASSASTDATDSIETTEVTKTTDVTEATAPVDERGMFARRDELVAAAVDEMTKGLRRVLADEQNAAMAAIGLANGWPETDDVLPPLDDHPHRWALAAAPALVTVVTGGVAEVDPDDGPSDEVLDAAVARVSGAFAASVVEPLRHRVTRALDEARTDLGDDRRNIDHRDIAERISAVYREWKRQRLRPAADEAGRAAFAAAVVEAAASDGRKVVWRLDPSVETCSPDCEDDSLSGPVAAGASFPTGRTHPPSHSGCRCLAIPE